MFKWQRLLHFALTVLAALGVSMLSCGDCGGGEGEGEPPPDGEATIEQPAEVAPQPTGR